MRILIDIGHPAHVHLFKNFAWKMQEKGHIILFTCRDKEFVLRLLQVYGFIYENFGKHYKSIVGKIQGLIKNELQMFNNAIQFKPDLFLSHGSSIAAFTSFLLQKPHISFEDTFNMEQVRLYLLFTDVVLTGDYPHPSLGRKEINYPGYHELAYLHPNVFTPDENILKEIGIMDNEKYAIIRFVAWNATHDIGHRGFSKEKKIKLVTELSRYIKVFISSEGDLPEELKQYQIKIKPENMHNVLYYTQLLVGESATMASECAMVGTPAIYINNSHFGSLDSQAEYGLVHLFSEDELAQEHAIQKAIEIVSKPDIKNEYRERAQKMLENKIDVTSFMIWFVENYPESVKKVKSPEFSFDRFK
jgi:predicted glycosyltransferase